MKEKINIELSFSTVEDIENEIFTLKKKFEKQKFIWSKVVFLNKIWDLEKLHIVIFTKTKINFSYYFDLDIDNTYESFQNMKELLFDLLKNIYIEDMKKNAEEIYQEKNLDWVLLKQWKNFFLIFKENWKLIKQKFNFELYIKLFISKIFDVLWDWLEMFISDKKKKTNYEFIIDSKIL